MPRHLVCLSFDLVAATDDDAAIGAARVLDLLKDRGLCTTWFVPGAAVGVHPAVGERLLRDGHEIALRGPASGGEAQAAQAAEAALAAIRRLAGAAPRGFRAIGGGPGLGPAWLVRNGFLYDASQVGLSWWPRRLRAGDGAGEGGVIAMPVGLALGDAPPAPARAVMQDWRDEFLAMRDGVDWGVLTCALPLAAIGRGAVLRAFADFLDTVSAGGGVVVTLEDAAREAAERIGGGPA